MYLYYGLKDLNIFSKGFHLGFCSLTSAIGTLMVALFALDDILVDIFLLGGRAGGS